RRTRRGCCRRRACGRGAPRPVAAGVLMRRVLRALAVCTAAAGLMLFAAAPASAHTQLVGSTPAEGETLAELPAEFSVTMNERVLDDAGLSAFALRVRDADGLY